jgi:hypothetical protein
VTSLKKIEANRRNAAKSTRPVPEDGKERSRGNAVRHGLTTETVIGVLADAEDYKAFEAALALPPVRNKSGLARRDRFGVLKRTCRFDLDRACWRTEPAILAPDPG